MSHPRFKLPRPFLASPPVCGMVGGEGPAGQARERPQKRQERQWSWSRSTSSPTPSVPGARSEEHTSELQSLMRISYAVFCLKKKKKQKALNDTTKPK